MMRKDSVSFPFEGKLNEYVQILLDYYLELTSFSSISSTLGKILGYLSIYGKLTQSQLKMLTGYSKSTISTGLANLINVGHVKKQKLRRSREYEYYMEPHSRKSIDFALGSMEKEIVFLKNKIKELNLKSLEKKKGYKLLFGRLKETLEVFELYQEILEELMEYNEESNFELKKKHSNEHIVTDFENISLKFDPQIKGKEDEIIDFFLYESVYSFLEEFTIITHTYFITRKILTQERIRELTGLSLGKVSQICNSLINKELVKVIDKKIYEGIIPEDLERKTIYAMPSILDSFFQSGINSLEKMIKWENKFRVIKENLEKNQEKLKKLRGYREITKAVKNFLDLLPLYKKAGSIFSKIMEKNGFSY